MSHKFQGEYESGMILEMLNGTPVPRSQKLTRDQRARFLRLIKDIKTLLEMVGPQWNGILTDQISEQFQCVNVKLAEYPVSQFSIQRRRTTYNEQMASSGNRRSALRGSPFNESLVFMQL